MDFEAYKARIQGFASCFAMLDIVNALKKETFTPGDYKAVKDDISSSLRKMMTGDGFSFPQTFTPLPIEMLNSIHKVNLAADLETITQQAELVKNEIIRLGEFFRLANFGGIRNMDPTKNLPIFVTMTDYIRDPADKVVNPFDFWEDCIEVYLLKHLRDYTNGKIVKGYDFKSSDAKDERARRNLVAGILEETVRLKEAVNQNKFPPKILSAGKQPTMIF